MPIHDLGYRRWNGTYANHWVRFWVIAWSGVRVVLRNKWVRGVLIAAWLPLLPFGAFFFAYEQYLEEMRANPASEVATQAFLADRAVESPDFAIIQEGLSAQDPGEGRHIIWSLLMARFFQIPQAISAMLVIGMIAPPLIARDIRTRAFLLYFSRPINRYEYVLGKIAIVSIFLSFITMGPVLASYVFGLALSSDVGAVLDTWDLPFRALFASLVFIVPAVSVALMFSSLTSESRFAGFAWFATWGLGFVAWQVMFAVMLANSTIKINEDFRGETQARYAEQERLRNEADAETKSAAVNLTLSEVLDAAANETGGDRAEIEEQVREVVGPGGQTAREVFKDGLGREFTVDQRGFQFVDPIDAEIEQRRREAMGEAYRRLSDHPLSMVSMYHTLVRLQRWIFGLEPNFGRVAPSLLATLLITTFSIFVLLRRVAAPIQV